MKSEMKITAVMANIGSDANIGRAEVIEWLRAVHPAATDRPAVTTPIAINGSHRFIPARDDRRSANQNANIASGAPSEKPRTAGPSKTGSRSPKSEIVLSPARSDLNSKTYSMIV